MKKYDFCYLDWFRPILSSNLCLIFNICFWKPIKKKILLSFYRLFYIMLLRKASFLSLFWFLGKKVKLKILKKISCLMFRETQTLRKQFFPIWNLYNNSRIIRKRKLNDSVWIIFENIFELFLYENHCFSCLFW